MLSISPVYSEEMVDCEKVIALDQEEYIPLIVLPLEHYTKPVMTRWEFTDAERKIIAEGGNLMITELTFGNLFTPLGLEVVPKNERPKDIDIAKV